MLSRLAGLVTRRPAWLVAAGVIAAVVAALLASGTMTRLSLNRFEAPGSESARARDVLAERFGTGVPNVALLVTAREGTVDDPRVAAAGRDLTRRLAAHPGAGDVWSYWTTGQDTLRSRDARGALVLAWVPGSADHVRRDVLPGLARAFTGPSGPVRVEVGGGDEVFRQVMEESRSDFTRAELIIVPMVLLALWWVYRRLAAALLTLGAGLLAVAGSLALLRGVLGFAEVSTFAANVCLVMGMGLGVDYGLFMIFRFREERLGGAPVRAAVATTVRTAGRTVLFSGLTVAASLAVLLVFPFPFLASFGYAGIAVVLAAVAAALVVLPAALVLLGSRVERRRPAPSSSSLWYGAVLAVTRRPLISGGAALLVLGLLGAPFLGLRFGAPDDRVLPASAPARLLYDQVRTGFAAEDADALRVVAPTGDAAAAGPYAAALSRLEGVVRVDSAAGTFGGGRRTGDPAPARFTAHDGRGGTWLSVVPSSARLESGAGDLIRAVRAVPAPFEVLVGGSPAEMTDYHDGVAGRLPLVAALIVLVTLVVLFLMTGSVVAPLKTSLLNLVSLSVMFGALVWVFQDGHLAGPLAFTPTGSIEPSIPILMFCVAYGLSMDYEILLLARIKEEHERTGDPRGSVVAGVSRGAPLVTAAAVILALSFATYATSGVVFLKELGIGMALTVAVDATVIRAVLVPALMRLTGRANWWAPAPLRRLHRRIGLTETPVPHPVPSVPGAGSNAVHQPDRL
ncbi:MMPL family transporter [Streptosporangium sp. NPDC000239]|uniref:MMPL family transporter n=1 Tax=Streptosporangium sp. NPDC000239 TaxID=3154248 RepID=UPI0033173E11